jgi:crossover junction endodeoxyribonuclease RuvC
VTATETSVPGRERETRPGTEHHHHVIGIDLSLTATGMSDGAVTWTVKSTGTSGATLHDRTHRLSLLWAQITGHIATPSRVDLVVIEQPAFSRQNGHMHDRSGLWWLVVDWLTSRGIPVVEVAPTALKKYATGKGTANKGAVVDATARRFPDIDTGSGDDNRCDALWLAAMGIDYLTGVSVVPAAQRAVLDNVAWPQAVAS